MSREGGWKTKNSGEAGSAADKKKADAPISLAWMPQGFKLSNGQMNNSGEGQSWSQLYSDGLSAFTVFIEESTEKSKPAKISRIGATVAATREFASNDSVYDVTVVGELPPKTVKKMLKAVK